MSCKAVLICLLWINDVEALNSYPTSTIIYKGEIL